MTAEAEAVSPAELSSLPACTLTADQLGDLELLLSGALAPLTGFMTAADAAAVADTWRLADGTPFPAVVTLDVPATALPADAAPDRILLSDPEGTPIAVMTITERTASGAGPGAAGRPRVGEPATRARAIPPADADTRGSQGPAW